MPYYTQVLQPDEQVRVIGRLHWSIYLRGLFVLVIALALLIGSAWLPDPDWQPIALWAGAAIGLIGLLLRAFRRLAAAKGHGDRRDRPSRDL